MSYEIVKGDTGPAMPVTLTVSGTAIDVSGADTVVMRWAKPDGTVTESTLTVLDASVGSFQMEWSTGDTDQIGAHIGEVVVTTGSEIETFPNDGTKIIWFVNPTVSDLVE